MSRCIIHIGMHKTGSTSIQSSLEGFEDDHFYYARLGKGGNHSLPVYSAFAAVPERHHLHRANGRDLNAVRAYIEQVWIDLDRSIAASQGRTLLISGEDIGLLSRRDVAKLHDCIRRRFDDATIVGYVRPPAGFMASSFQQRVRSAAIESFEPEALYRNYQVSFGKFDEVFGREKVQVWKFDPKTFPEGCVVQDFCRRLGIAFPKERIVRLNESLAREAVTLLYIYGKLGEEYGSRTMPGAEGMKLGRLIGGSSRFRLSPDVVRPVLDANRSDMEWMEARLGQSLQEDLGDEQPGDIGAERDLMQPDRELVEKLLTLVGDAAPEGVKGDTPEEIALLVHALRAKHGIGTASWRREKIASRRIASAPAGQQRVAQVELGDLIKQISLANPNLLNEISPDQATGLVGNIFNYLNERLAGTENRVVSVAGLGQFRLFKSEADASRGDAAQMRITFRPYGDRGGNI